MAGLLALDIPQLEGGMEPLSFSLNHTLPCDLVTKVRVLPYGLALHRQAAMYARVWVEEQLQESRRHEDPYAMSGSDVEDADDDDDGNGGGFGEERRQQQASRRKKFVKLVDEDLLIDWYDVLHLVQRDRSTEEEIRAAYRRRCLETHPDKQTGHSDAAFKQVQRAFDILGDPETRLTYDSSRPFDDAIPGETLPVGADFYATFGPVFERNKKWSSEPNMPHIGDDNTSLKNVHQFYDRWARFQSWRDFSHLVDLDEIDDSMCREEKRYYMRENERQLNHLRREEQQRIRTLVERARKNDPRLRRKREEEELQRQREKHEREEKRRLLREDAERRRAEEAERERLQREEVQRKAVEAKNAIRQAQKDMLAFLELHGLLDDTATNKLLEHVVRRPNVVWIFSKISSPEEAVDVLSNVTSSSTERRHAVEGHGNCNDDDEGIEVEAVLRFNALVEEKERQLGVTRYGEPLKIRSAANTTTTRPKSPQKNNTSSSVSPSPAVKTVKEWEKEDLIRLQKANAKYPPGSVERWSRITSMLRGKFTEEEAMAKVNEITAELHQSSNNKNAPGVAAQQQSSSTTEVVKSSSPDAAKTLTTQASSTEDWTVKQQKMLEQGLRELKDYKEKDKFQKIAGMVDGKTARECFERFKYLCAINKRK